MKKVLLATLSAACLSHPARAQLGAFGGEAVSADNLAPIAYITVSLIDPNPLVGITSEWHTTIRRRTHTDARGLFELPHLDSGVFRLRFDLPGKMPVFGPIDTVSADSVVERRYKLAFVDAEFDSVFSKTQVDTEVEMDWKHSRAPRYPGSLEQRGIPGGVLLSFVVDTLGRAEMATVKTLLTTNEAFSKAVLDVLPKMRFVPATFQGRKVRQLAHQSFQFAVPGRDLLH